MEIITQVYNRDFHEKKLVKYSNAFKFLGNFEEFPKINKSIK